jgi:hypothetical protein
MKKTIPALVTLASLMGMALVGLGQETKTSITTTVRERRIEHAEPEAGWLVRPQEFRLDRTWGQVGERGAIVTGYPVVDRGGMLRVFVVQSGPGAVDSPPHRVVVFSREGARHPLRETDAGGMTNRDTEARHAVFTLDPKVLAADEVAEIAIERVKPGRGRRANPD